MLANLLTRYQQGDDAVGPELLGHVDRLAGAAIRDRPWRVPGLDLADLIQEARFSVFAAIGTFVAVSGSAAAWCLSVVQNRFRDLFEKSQARKRAPSGICFLAEIPEEAAPDDPEQTALAHLAAAEIFGLARTPIERGILRGLADGLALREIARTLGIPRQRAARVRNSLRKRAGAGETT